LAKNPHDELFEAYVVELRDAKARAEQWWTALQAAEQRRDPSTGPKLSERWPFGAASHPWIIAVYRKYFLACDALNQQRLAERARTPPHVREADWGEDEEGPPPITQIPPRVFAFEKLETDATRDLYEFMIALIYSPIGMLGDDFV
jgi:hypothetical protein